MGQSVQLSNGLPSCIRPGEILGGKYRLERELGRGAMGTVWAAMHLTLGQRVAIKLIAAEHAQAPEARARFRTEAKAAARLKSRHVVQIYDDGETPEGTPYIVMEYLEGESLEGRLDREGSIPLVDAVRITGQVARALGRAHAQGIVHRDLKPGNIYLARSDEDELGWIAKVVDFGIAKLDDHRDQSTTKTGTVLGTPLFMSPEQVRGASTVDQRADLYSLGICFYNMLTGQFAFDGESFGDILVSICTEPLPDLKAAAPWVPDSVAHWFSRCCAREPSARFQSADELTEALQNAVGNTVQIVARRSLPDEQLGPSGTIKGHSPPVSPHAHALGADDSGAFTVRFGAGEASSVESMPEPHRTTGNRSDATSVLTLRELEATQGPLKRRVPRAALAVLGLVIVAAIVLFLRSDPGAKESLTENGPLSAAQPTAPSTPEPSEPEPAPLNAASETAPSDTQPATEQAALPEAVALPKPAAPHEAALPVKAAQRPKPRPAAATPRATSASSPAGTGGKKSPVDLGF